MDTIDNKLNKVTNQPQKLLDLIKEILLGSFGDVSLLPTDKMKIIESTNKSIVNILNVENDLYFNVKCYHESNKKQISFFTFTEYLLFNEELDNELYNLYYEGEISDLKFSEINFDEKDEVIIEDENLSYQ